MPTTTTICCLFKNQTSYIKCCTILFNLIILLDLGFMGFKIHREPIMLWEKQFVIQLIYRLGFLVVSLATLFQVRRKVWKFVEYYGLFVIMVFLACSIKLVTNLVFLAFGKSSLVQADDSKISKDQILLEVGVYSGALVVYLCFCYLAATLVLTANALKVKEIRSISEMKAEEKEFSSLGESQEQKDIVIKSS